MDRGLCILMLVVGALSSSFSLELKAEDLPTIADTLDEALAVPAGDEGYVEGALDANFWLTQMQPEESVAAAPEVAPSALALAAARRRRSTYRLPSMFGDFFAVGSLQATFQEVEQSGQTLNVPAGGGAVGRIKVAENNSPIPRNRFFFNYNFFNNVAGGIGDVNRYEFGYEQTFWEESSSIEIAVPFASTLDANQFDDGRRATDTRFGDVAIALKTILFEGESCLIAGGLGLSFPSSGDSRVFDFFGDQILRLENETVHIQPYLAALHSYESGWYWQGFLQVDVDAGRTTVLGDTSSGNLQEIGVLQEQTLLFLDVGFGYWLTQASSGTPAVAVTAEIHYATTLQDADVVGDDFIGFQLASSINRFDIVNLTLGASILANDAFTIRPAMVIPLAGGDDDQFDYEAMVQMNFWR